MRITPIMMIAPVAPITLIALIVHMLSLLACYRLYRFELVPLPAPPLVPLVVYPPGTSCHVPRNGLQMLGLHSRWIDTDKGVPNAHAALSCAMQGSYPHP